MNILILDLLLYSFISFAQITDAYKMYTMDKNGKITFQKKPLHIDVEYMKKEFKDRLKKQVDDYLEQKNRKEIDITYKNSEKNHDHGVSKDLTRILKASPSINGDKIKLDLYNVNENDIKYYKYETEPEEKSNFKNDEIITDIKYLNTKQIDALKRYLKNENSLRKFNEIIAQFKTKHRNFENHRQKQSKYDVYKHGPVKRFRIVNNRKGKHNKMVKNWDDIDEKSCENNDSRLECQEVAEIKLDSFSGEHKTYKDENDSVYEYTDDDELFYLQGPRKIKKKDSEKDKRRRLSHFMPKRYHWDPEDIHKLGYFWFNGPRGKYPYPKRVE